MKFPKADAFVQDAKESLTTFRRLRWLRSLPVQGVEYGFRMRFPTMSSPADYEQSEIAWLAQQLPSADLLVDVGAHVGLYSLIARQANLHVIAIEPVSTNVALLQSNLALNGWSDVEVFPLAVSDSPGIVSLYGSGTAASLVVGWAGRAEAPGTPTPASTLDILVASRFSGSRIIVKIDVEGWESAVLRGADALLAQDPPPVWLVELDAGRQAPGGSPRASKEAVEIFRSRGYSAYLPSGPMTRITSEAAESSCDGRNVVFVKE